MTTAHTTGTTTTYSRDDLHLGVVAIVRYQGGWTVRRVISPDEFALTRVATRDYAEALAVRHAYSL
jgi:hypothetical protein